MGSIWLSCCPGRRGEGWMQWSVALVHTCSSHRLQEERRPPRRRALSTLMTKQLEAIFQLGQRLWCIRLELWVTEMNETSAVLTIPSAVMGRPRRATAVTSLPRPSGAAFVTNVCVAAGRGEETADEYGLWLRGCHCATDEYELFAES